MPDCRNCVCCWDEDFDTCTQTYSGDTALCQALQDGCSCNNADNEEQS